MEGDLEETSVGSPRGTLLLQLSGGYVNVKGLETAVISGQDISVPLGIKVCSSDNAKGDRVWCIMCLYGVLLVIRAIKIFGQTTGNQ